jgi:hypothetical protein
MNGDGKLWISEARDWRSSDPNAVLQIGVDKSELSSLAQQGLSWKLGQLYGIVSTGLISAQHVFEGAKRRMYVENDADADQKMLFFTWRALRDAKYKVPADHNEPLEFVNPPVSSVFFVMVSPNGQSQHTEVFGWARHWGWVEAHTAELGAPLDWENKYDRRLAY